MTAADCREAAAKLIALADALDAQAVATPGVVPEETVLTVAEEAPDHDPGPFEVIPD